MISRLRPNRRLAGYGRYVVHSSTFDRKRAFRCPFSVPILVKPLNGFLFGINANRVKPEIRERLIRYQKECYRVLADAFLETTVAEEDWMTTSPETRAALERIREMGQAVARMADEQLRIMTRLDKAAIVVGQHNRRITALERQLSPRDAITEEQAADIAEKVKAIAMALTEQDSSKNHFQAIFSELYRRFRVSGYKNIRQSQYHDVLDFLDEWLAAGSKKLEDGNNQND